MMFHYNPVFALLRECCRRYRQLEPLNWAPCCYLHNVGAHLPSTEEQHNCEDKANTRAGKF
jgi:hypothetical protein